jgi:ribosomal protein S18 acetylase RimI-like enzyme
LGSHSTKCLQITTKKIKKNPKSSEAREVVIKSLTIGNIGRLVNEWRELSATDKKYFTPWFLNIRNLKTFITTYLWVLSTVRLLKDTLFKMDFPVFLSFIAENTDQKKIAGFCYLLKERTKAGQKGKFGWFGVFVFPDYQHKGVGEKMVRLALEIGWKKGLSEIYLRVALENKRAMSLFSKYSFKIIQSVDNKRVIMKCIIKKPDSQLR